MRQGVTIDRQGKVPPQDLDAEKSVLGCLLFSSTAYDDVIQHVNSQSFYSHQNQQIFQCVRELYERGTAAIDVVILAHELEKCGNFDKIGGAAYLNDVMQSVPHAAHAEYYAKIVYEKWVQRTLIEACERTLRETYEGTDDLDHLLGNAEKRLFALLEQRNSLDLTSLNDMLDAAFQRLFERMDRGDAISGISSGLHGLDNFIHGFQPTELLVLAARPAMGKTALVCNFALSVASTGNEVLIFSLEQSKLELVERLLSIYAKVDSQNLRRGKIDEFQQATLGQAANEMRLFPIFIDDTAGRTVSQIAAIARRTHRRHGLKLIMIDYLQLVEADDRHLPREQQISSITRRLKFLAKELEVPVIALAQVNRGVEQREDKRPRLSDLRESGAIEQDADIVMFLHRPDAYDPEDRPGEADLIIAKNRHGQIGTVELIWLREMLRFGDRCPVYLDI